MLTGLGAHRLRLIFMAWLVCLKRSYAQLLIAENGKPIVLIDTQASRFGRTHARKIRLLAKIMTGYVIEEELQRERLDEQCRLASMRWQTGFENICSGHSSDV